MPNNVNPIPWSVVPYQTSVQPTSPAQSGFGNVTTLIYSPFNNFQWPVTSSLGGYVMFGTTSGSYTNTVEVGDYNNHTFQLAMTGSGTSSVYVSSSIDGYNWVPDFNNSINTVSSSIVRLTGRRRYFQINMTNTTTNTSASVYILSGQ